MAESGVSGLPVEGGGHTIAPPADETMFEYANDAVLGLVFLVIALIAAQR